MALSTTNKKRPAGVAPAKPRGLDQGAYKPGGAAYQGRKDDVGKVAADMMGKDSPLMQRAAQRGLMQANARGLMNSSMAAGAAQGAMLDQIVPMASQTAGQEFQKNRAGQQYQIDSESAWRDEDIAARGDERQFGYQSDLSAQESRQRIDETDAEYAQRRGLSAQESKQRIGETAAEYAQRRGLSAQEAQQTSRLSAQESKQRVGETNAEYAQRMRLSSQEAAQMQDQTRLEYGQRGTLSAQEARQQQDLTRLQGSQERITNRQQSGLRQQEAKQQFKFDREKIKVDARMQQQLQRQGFNFDKQLADIENDFQAKQKSLDRSLEKLIADKRLSADTARGAETMLNNTFNDYSDTISRIMQNPDLSADERKSQIKAAKTNVGKRVDMMESMYSIDFKWPGTGGADDSRARDIGRIGNRGAGGKKVGKRGGKKGGRRKK